MIAFSFLKRFVFVFFLPFLFISCHTPKSSVLFPVIYFDMDGTLLGNNGEVRPRSLDAIKKYQACGGQVGIATGKGLEQMAEYNKMIQPNFPLVLSNGGVIFDAQKEVIV